MKQHSEHRLSLKKLLRDEGGAILIITTVYLPVIVGFFTMAVDMSYVYRTRNLLQVTADAAALAAVGTMIQNPTNIDYTLACPAAKAYATKNMDPASYKYVLKQNSSDCSDVLLGYWNGTKFASDASSACNTSCNAVQVTTRMSVANNNPLPLTLATIYGFSTFNVTATSVAIYLGDPSATPLNISVIQDVSGSFTQEIGSAKSADQDLANCINQNAPANSKLGVGLFGVTASNYQPPLVISASSSASANASANSSALTNKLTAVNIDANGVSGNGTDIAAGLNTGISQICPGTTCTPLPTTFKPAIVLVTDGMPNTCGGQSCSTSTAQANAVTQANAAKADGIDIYVVYFCNDGNNTCGSAANPTSEYVAGQWLSTQIATQPKPNDTKQYFFNSTNPGADFAKFMRSVCLSANNNTIRLVQ